VIDESDLQNEKRRNPRISTLFGITIDRNDGLENASDSIRVNCEFNSNVIHEIELQREKQCDPRISALSGITID
jgi:hypothetical protein